MTAIQKRSAKARTGRSRARVILVGGMFTALLAVAGVAGRGFFADATPPAPPPGDQYRGIIQYGARGGECERFEFDNQTGVLRSQGRIWCTDRTASTGAAPPSTEPSGQLTGVRDYFKPR